MNRQEHDRLVDALQRWKDATFELYEAWPADEGDAVLNYPSFMPDFGDFQIHVEEIGVRPMPAYVIVDSPEHDDRFAARYAPSSLDLEYTMVFDESGEPNWTTPVMGLLTGQLADSVKRVLGQVQTD